MDIRSWTNWALQRSPVADVGTDHSEEIAPEVDEEPDEHRAQTRFMPAATPLFDKNPSALFQRRESLLTRQLHSEAEHTDDEAGRFPTRALSTQSTWSTASTAELTSDDGRSAPSPAISPPLPPTQLMSVVPSIEKALAPEPKIVSQDDAPLPRPSTETPAEQAVEAGLGRRRCISFACGGKDKKAAVPASTLVKVAEEPAAASPPKRKCALKFLCPTRTSTPSKPTDDTTLHVKKRTASPPPPGRDAPESNVVAKKMHRGSDSTITKPSENATEPSIVTTAPTPIASSAPRRFSNDDSDGSAEATRFHEFAYSDGEPEDWVQESTCHRSRLTVGDTLKKETYLRKTCEEVEEEVIEEEDEDEAEADADAADEDEDELAEDLDDDAVSDEGFRTDDEEGFADSDADDDDSDEEWWRPGALSTAATSVDNMERRFAAARPSGAAMLASSVGSASSGSGSRRPYLHKVRSKARSTGVAINNRRNPVDLPDSTDFVCGTLDEDRPLEQAFINNMRQREAAKHKIRPQDIDPTFPTSDPEMDEEDDEDLEDLEESETPDLMHGELDELDGDLTARRRDPPAARHAHRSPPPPVRHRSPAPLRRMATRSPPPPGRKTTRSPAPPRKLFDRSPVRGKSPAPPIRVTSPPNTRPASPILSPAAMNINRHGLATRTQLTHTASLPRNAGFMLSRLGKLDEDEGSGLPNDTIAAHEFPKRGAIDIVKGLEKKRQRRKEKLYAKMCAKAAAKGEKAYKVKPGRGAERMREVGLELQRYHGKGEHILSM